MLRKNEITNILDALGKDGIKASEEDVVYLILSDTLTESEYAYFLAYGVPPRDIKKFCETEAMKKLREKLAPFGVGKAAANSVSKEENKAELIKMLQKVEKWGANGEIDPERYAKLVLDYRVRLNDKFDMEDDEKKKRIFIVPQKHDIVCPHTHKECTYMPTKEACKEYYKLKG